MTQDAKNWFSKHVDAIVTISTVIGGILWMTDRFEHRFNAIEKDLTVIKTVLVLKGIMPESLVKEKVPGT